MALYKPGKQEPRKQGERRRSGGHSAAPRGRCLQVDTQAIQVVVDKVTDYGKEGFDEEVQAARDDASYPEHEADLLEKFGNMESGQSVWLGLRLPFENRSVRINLARLTEPELDAFRDAMLRAVDEARPEVVRRDEEAKRAYDEGFVHLYRLHRSAPQVVDFGRKKSEHSQELSVGREGVRPVGSSEEA